MPTDLLLAVDTKGGDRVDWGTLIAFIGGGGVGGAVTQITLGWWQRKTDEKVHDLEESKASSSDFDLFTSKLMERMEKQEHRLDTYQERLDQLGKALEEEKQKRRDDREEWDKRLLALRTSFRRMATLFRQLQDHVAHRNGMLDRWFPTGIPADFPHTPAHLLTPLDDLDDQVGG